MSELIILTKKKEKEEKKEETVQTPKISYDYSSDLEELEPKSYVRAGFIYHIEHEGIQIKSKSDLTKRFNDFMKKD